MRDAVSIRVMVYVASMSLSDLVVLYIKNKGFSMNLFSLIKNY